MTLGDEHLQELRTAKVRLETTSFLVRVANTVGQPLENLVGALPGAAREAIDRATRTSLERAMEWAVASIGTTGETKSRAWLHKGVVTASGGLGGALGWGGLAVELPFSTVVMLRSIAAIARENGEDLGSAEVRLECLAVLSYGGSTSDDDAAETTYYATRAGLAASLQRAAAQMTSAMAGGQAHGAAKLASGFIGRIAGRFGIVVQEKAVAQTVPVLGALGGAALNHLFIDHFQAVARGHFTVRRLERIYGEDAVQAAYEEIRL